MHEKITYNLKFKKELYKKQKQKYQTITSKRRKTKVIVSDSPNLLLAFGFSMIRKNNNVLFLDFSKEITEKLLIMNFNHFVYPPFTSDIMNNESSIILEFRHLYKLHGSKGVGQIGLIPGDPTHIEKKLTNYDEKYIFQYFKDLIDYYKLFFDYVLIHNDYRSIILNRICFFISNEIFYEVNDTLSLVNMIDGAFMEPVINPKKQKTNFLIAMTKFREDLYENMKEIFGDYLCNNYIKNPKYYNHDIPGFKRNSFVELANEMQKKIHDPKRKNGFDIIYENDFYEKQLQLNERIRIPIKKIPRYIIEKSIEERKNDIHLALKLCAEKPIGYTLKLNVKKKLGIEFMKKLDNPNFVRVLILKYAFNGKSLRKTKEEILGVYSSYYHGGHVYGNILHEFDIYKEHKEILNKDDLNNILKKYDIYNVAETQPIKTSVEFFDLCKEIGLMIDESKQTQKNIDYWM